MSDGNYSFKVHSTKYNAVPANPAIWLDAYDYSQYLIDGNNNPVTTFNTDVSAWFDKSGNNRHFSQDIPTMRPTLVNTISGLPYLKFNNTRHSATIGAHLTGNNNALTFSNNVSGVTLIAMAQYSANSPTLTAEMIFACTIGAPGALCVPPLSPNTISRIRFGTNVQPVPAGGSDTRGFYIAGGGRRTDCDSNDQGAPSPDTGGVAVAKNVLYPAAVAGLYDYAGAKSTTSPISATMTVFQNGSLAGYDPAFQQAGNTSPSNSTRTAIGRRFVAATPYFFNGYLGEFIAYERLLTDQELGQLNTYLLRKWGVQQTPHIFKVHTLADTAAANVPFVVKPGRLLSVTKPVNLPSLSG